MNRARLQLIACACAAAVLFLLGPAGRLGVVSLVLMFAPGFVLTRLLPGQDLDIPFVQPAIWLGLSISMIAMLYQWVTACGLFLSEPTLAILAGVCALAMFGLVWRDSGKNQRRAAAGRHARMNLAAVTLGVCLLLAFGLRLYQIRDLVLPAWVDSVHHALLIRIALERGQAPLSLYPYLPIDQLPYHWGYHVLAATSARLSGVTVTQVMLWQGQALSSLHVLTCAALAAYLWRNSWAGSVAGLVVGFISIMPAFYTSWGRYTQLTGLLLLPPLAICWHALLQQRKPRLVVICALLLGGLNLVHFRVLILALCLLGALTATWAIAEQPQAVLWGLVRGTTSALAGVGLTLPWLWLLLQRRLIPVVEQPQSFFDTGSYGELSLSLLWSGQNRLLAALALLGALVAMRYRPRATLAMVVWVAGLVIIANPQLLLYMLPVASIPLIMSSVQNRRPILAVAALPLMLCNPFLLRFSGSWLITNDVVVISLFVPLSVLIGGLVLPFARGFLRNRSVLHVSTVYQQFAAALAVLALALWGAYANRDIIRPSTVLATQADVEAIDWVAANTPADARFLINAAPWLSTADRGVDGGWWLLPLTGRWTSTPPVIFDYGPPAYVKATRQQTRTVARFEPGQETAIMEIIEQQRIGYVYVKEGVGPLTRAVFADTQRFVPIYERDGVTILAVTSQT